MANKPGKAWQFPDYGNDTEKLAMAKIRIGWLEAENQKLRDSVQQLEAELVERDNELEILDAEIDNENDS